MTAKVRSDLKEMRVNKGLSLRGAARQMEIGEQTLARAESGRSIHPSNALSIARFYDLDVTDIWPIDDHNGRDAA